MSVSRAPGQIARMLRVNHAGELGAEVIYAGQLAVLRGTPAGDQIAKMKKEEKHHLNVFEDLVVKHRVRPTLLSPVWSIFGFGLGAMTAMMGSQAAMACTVAVETVIGKHYNDQLREIANAEKKWKVVGSAAQNNPNMIINSESNMNNNANMSHIENGVKNAANGINGIRNNNDNQNKDSASVAFGGEEKDAKFFSGDQINQEHTSAANGNIFIIYI